MQIWEYYSNKTNFLGIIFHKYIITHFPMHIYDRIKKVRELNKLSKLHMANRLGMDSSHYVKIESGTKGLTLEKLSLFCSEFNINANWLLTGEGSMARKEPEMVDVGENEKFNGLGDKERLIKALQTTISLQSQNLDDLRKAIKDLRELVSLKNGEIERLHGLPPSSGSS